MRNRGVTEASHLAWAPRSGSHTLQSFCRRRQLASGSKPRGCWGDLEQVPDAPLVTMCHMYGTLQSLAILEKWPASRDVGATSGGHEVEMATRTQGRSRGRPCSVAVDTRVPPQDPPVLKDLQIPLVICSSYYQVSYLRGSLKTLHLNIATFSLSPLLSPWALNRTLSKSSPSL